MPPCCAMAMAMRDSVTVSMAAVMIGTLSVTSRVSLVCVFTRRGQRGSRREAAHVVESKRPLEQENGSLQLLPTRRDDVHSKGEWRRGQMGQPALSEVRCGNAYLTL